MQIRREQHGHATLYFGRPKFRDVFEVEHAGHVQRFVWCAEDAEEEIRLGSRSSACEWPGVHVGFIREDGKRAYDGWDAEKTKWIPSELTEPLRLETVRVEQYTDQDGRPGRIQIIGLAD